MGAKFSARNDILRTVAIAVVAVAIPLYSAVTYDVNGETSFGRWLAVHVLMAELVLVLLAVASGWRPLASMKAMPRHLRLALGIWIAGATIATVSSSVVETSLLFQSMWMLHITFAIALWAMLDGAWRDWRRALLLAFTGGLLLHSLGLYIVAFVVVGRPDLSFEFYSFGMSNPRLYVFIADALLGLGLGLFITATSRRESTAFAIAVFAAYCLFAWTGGRASFGVSLLLPLIVVFLSGWRNWKALLVCYTSAAVAYPLSLFTVPDHRVFGFKSVLGRAIPSRDPEPNFDYSSARIDIWETVLRKSANEPVFGHGQIFIPQYWGNISAGRFVVEPHNAFVQIAYHWGLVGLVALVLAVGPFLFTIRRRLSTEPGIALPAFAVLLALAISSMLDGVYFFTVPLFINAVMLAILATVPATPAQVGR